MYFVNTSTLGTHTFFMTMIPSLIFFGYYDIAQGCVPNVAGEHLH